VGGLAVLGFVAAPMIFSALEAHDPATGRALAGLVFGAVFERFQYWAWLLGGLSMLLLGGPRLARPAASSIGAAHVAGGRHAVASA
jgi:hypothetical protein